MLLQILIHTPRWVYVLFAVLVWYGLRQMAAGTVSALRALLLPFAMVGLSLYGVASAFGDAPLALAGWAATAAVLLAWVRSRPVPAGTRYDAAGRRFHLPGSAMPLVLMMGIFFTKYAVAVALSIHPALQHQPEVQIGISLLYGAFSGLFAGRALRLWKLALRQDRALVGSQAA